jgi:hypothetical protein
MQDRLISAQSQAAFSRAFEDRENCFILSSIRQA